ncbi:MAG: hypothetical protein RBS77_01950 [Candidatus Moranbacteria bacterium]|jgi:hypothetical protein|nr:hypothetical protein [Candidatus Moranbacteria bacterium]
MQPIENVIKKLAAGKRIMFETPQMRNKFIQGATVIDVDPNEKIVIVETQGKEISLGNGTMVSIDAT